MQSQPRPEWVVRGRSLPFTCISGFRCIDLPDANTVYCSFFFWQSPFPAPGLGQKEHTCDTGRTGESLSLTHHAGSCLRVKGEIQSPRSMSRSYPGQRYDLKREEHARYLRPSDTATPPPTCSCWAFMMAISFSTSQMWLVALATSARSRSRSASSCSMCCCFSFSASWRAVVPEIFRAYREEVSVSWKKS